MDRGVKVMEQQNIAWFFFGPLVKLRMNHLHIFQICSEPAAEQTQFPISLSALLLLPSSKQVICEHHFKVFEQLEKRIKPTSTECKADALSTTAHTVRNEMGCLLSENLLQKRE